MQIVPNGTIRVVALTSRVQDIVDVTPHTSGLTNPECDGKCLQMLYAVEPVAFLLVPH